MSYEYTLILNPSPKEKGDNPIPGPSLKEKGAFPSPLERGQRGEVLRKKSLH
jgi:hypothetical protein